MLHAAILHAQAETLNEWAGQHERSEVEGSGEVAFLMRRASRMCSLLADGKIPDAEPRLAPQDAPAVDTPKEG